MPRGFVHKFYVDQIQVSGHPRIIHTYNIKYADSFAGFGYNFYGWTISSMTLLHVITYSLES